METYTRKTGYTKNVIDFNTQFRLLVFSTKNRREREDFRPTNQNSLEQKQSNACNGKLCVLSWKPTRPHPAA